MPLIVREYRSDDVPAILACMHELQEWEREIDARMAPATKVIERLWQELLEDCDVFRGSVFVADLDGSVVGYIGVLTRVPHEASDEVEYAYAQITDVAVREAFRSHGVGTALLSHARRHAVESGARWLRINVLAGNRAAATLYRRCGFRDREIVMEQSLEPG